MGGLMIDHMIRNNTILLPDPALAVRVVLGALGGASLAVSAAEMLLGGAAEIAAAAGAVAGGALGATAKDSIPMKNPLKRILNSDG